MATGTPGTNGVWQYGEDDSEATFSALLNKAASTTDTQIGLDRGRLTTLEARNLSGLIPIPIAIGSVSIAGGTASATNGIITFTSGTTSISFNSIFSTSYTRFKVIYKIQASANGNQCYYRNRAATTDYTINYFGGGVQAQYTGTVSAYGPVNNGSQGMLGTLSTGANGLQGEFEIRPVAGTTTLDYRAYSTQISGVQVGGYESPSATRTNGFTIYPSAGTFQGTIQLFAYVN